MMEQLGIGVKVSLPSEAKVALKQIPSLKAELVRFNDSLQRTAPGIKTEFGRANTLFEKAARALPFVAIGGVVLVLAVTLIRSKD